MIRSTAIVAEAMIGVGHTLEMDHLAAVATLVKDDRKRPSFVGASWGSGTRFPSLEEDGVVTREKFNGEPGTYMGNVLLFDTTDGTLLAILNDGVPQHVRVGATAGVVGQILSREDSDVMGCLGEVGWPRLTPRRSVRSTPSAKSTSTVRRRPTAMCSRRKWVSGWVQTSVPPTLPTTQ